MSYARAGWIKEAVHALSRTLLGKMCGRAKGAANRK